MNNWTGKQLFTCQILVGNNVEQFTAFNTLHSSDYYKGLHGLCFSKTWVRHFCASCSTAEHLQVVAQHGSFLCSQIGHDGRIRILITYSSGPRLLKAHTICPPFQLFFGAKYINCINNKVEMKLNWMDSFIHLQ